MTRTPPLQDVIGRVYEDLLSQLASAEGRKGTARTSARAALIDVEAHDAAGAGEADLVPYLRIMALAEKLERVHKIGTLCTSLG